MRRRRAPAARLPPSPSARARLFLGVQGKPVVNQGPVYRVVESPAVVSPVRPTRDVLGEPVVLGQQHPQVVGRAAAESMQLAGLQALDPVLSAGRALAAPQNRPLLLRGF